MMLESLMMAQGDRNALVSLHLSAKSGREGRVATSRRSPGRIPDFGADITVSRGISAPIRRPTWTN